MQEIHPDTGITHLQIFHDIGVTLCKCVRFVGPFPESDATIADNHIGLPWSAGKLSIDDIRFTEAETMAVVVHEATSTLIGNHRAIGQSGLGFLLLFRFFIELIFISYYWRLIVDMKDVRRR